MGFPPDVAEKVLVDCGRCCVICHKFCGAKMELHHIKQVADGGEDTYDNCIPLCFDCHSDVKAYNPKHPKGRKYTDCELVAHRNKWYEKERNSIGTIPINDKQIALDIAVLNQIKLILSEENIPFLFHYTYHHDFEGKTADALHLYVDKCSDPNFEFFDVDMEIHKVDLYREIKNLIWLMVGLTTYYDGKFITSAKMDEWARIHNATLSVKDSFDRFIKLSRRKY